MEDDKTIECMHDLNGHNDVRGKCINGRSKGIDMCKKCWDKTINNEKETMEVSPCTND